MIPDFAPAAVAADVRRQATSAGSLAELERRSSHCRACPRLVAWREEVAAAPRRSFAGETYWGRPVTGWGDDRPGILLVGLAPAAHGGNRTGRIFTGDRSGDFLFAGLHRVGLATQATSERADDGQRLLGVRMAAAVRCAPPDNAPTPEERDRCAPWLDAELALVRPSVRAVVALGGFAWTAVLSALRRAGDVVPRPAPRFAHGAETDIGGLTLLGCFHPSQQNTFTGRLVPAMLDDVLIRARGRAAGGTPAPGNRPAISPGRP